jgi:ElaB/YqjD/DUF883 family membrane-anchored ribosome-binding protein
MTYDPNRPNTSSATERELDRKADQAHNTVNTTADKAHRAADDAHATIDRATDKAHDTVENVTDKAQQVAGDVKDKAQQVADKAQDLGQQAVERADAATTTVGEKMTDVAQTIRQNAPATGAVANAADTAADTLQRAGTYLQQQDLADMRGDVEDLIRRYPMQSLLIGFGVGYLLARSARR